jgi:LPS sulfotransferase NodH
MTLAISSTVAATIATTTSIGGPALNQASPAGAAANVTVTQAPTSSLDNPKFQESLKALGLHAKLADDLQGVASALAPAMQQIIADRPDLATAAFDFHADNGAIKVTSSSLSDSDKAWLEQTLNGNQALVHAVQVFHDDATASYGMWADATGQPLSAADAGKVSAQADDQFNFMSMFKNASQSMTQAMDPNGKYQTSNGAPIDFHQNVNSALSFLVFQKSNQAVLDGTNSYTTSTGRTYYAAIKGNFFADNRVIADFFPPTPSHSIGLSVSA